jgi:hypothetical protein
LKATFILTTFLAAMSLPACTAEQAYGTGQAWQRNQCNRLPDKAEYDRCMESANTSYEKYKRETEAQQR